MSSFEEENYFEGGQNNNEPCCEQFLLDGLTTNAFNNLKVTNVFDGIIFMSSELGFFRLPTPFDFGNVVIDSHCGYRFKGTEKWRKGLEHLLEFKIGLLHNHRLSILLAYPGRKLIPFEKLIQAVKQSFSDSIRAISGDSQAKTDLDNSIAGKILLRSREDFEKMQINVRTYLAHHLAKVREGCKFTFVLYKFGQSLTCEEFCKDFSWLNPMALETVIVHYAKDFMKPCHIIWFIPAAIKRVLADEPDAVYHVGIQPGLGNVRHVVKNSIQSTWTPTHVTWYSRIWQEIHRDPSGYFSRTRLGTSIASDYVDIFDSPNENLRLLKKYEIALRERVPTIIENSAKLQSQYSARVEIVSSLEVSNNKCLDLNTLLIPIVEKCEQWIQANGFCSPSVFYPQRTARFSNKIKPWFEHFSGTILNTCNLVDKLKLKKSEMADGNIVSDRLYLFKEIISLYAVDYLLTLCFTGNVMCSMKIRQAFGIGPNLFLQPGVDYGWKFPISFAENDKQKIIVPDAAEHLFYDFFDRIFQAKTPLAYERLYVCAADAIKTTSETAMRWFENKQRIETKAEKLANSLVDVFLSIASQYSDIYQFTKDTPTLIALISDVKIKEFQGAQIMTTTEFVNLLNSNAVKNQEYLDYRFWLYRNVAAKVCKENRHSRFWIFLLQTFNARILLTGCPIVCKRDPTSNRHTRDLLIVPTFQSNVFKDKFNKSWYFAAMLVSGNAIPDITGSDYGGVKVYECLDSLNEKEKSSLGTATFMQILISAIAVKANPNHLSDSEALHVLKDSSKYILLNEGEPIFTDQTACHLKLSEKRPNFQTRKATGKFGKITKNVKTAKQMVEDRLEDIASDENVLRHLTQFQGSVGPQDRNASTLLAQRLATDYQINRNTEICHYAPLNSVTLFDVALNFQGTCWMDILFLESCVYFMINKYCGKDTKIILLPFQTCMLINDWSQLPEQLLSITLATKTILHVLFLKNHYVLSTYDIDISSNEICVANKSYDTLCRGSYGGLVKEGCQKVLELLESRFRQIWPHDLDPVVHKSISPQPAFQQNDERNCGSAVIRVAESLLTDSPETSDEIFKLSLEEYKMRVVNLLLSENPTLQPLCGMYKSDPEMFLKFLRELK